MNGLGYRLELENHASLAATAKPFVLTTSFSAPHSISHRPWRKPARNQGPVGSCTGFGRSSGEEILNWIATGGQFLRLSAMFAYLENQRACGLIGADQGATIDGAVKAAAETGICRDALFPYPGRYITQIPEEAKAEGQQHLINSHSVLRSYDDVYQWISSGVGVVVIGVSWTSGLVSAGPKIEPRDTRGHVLGGHCMLLEGYDGNTVDAHGRPYIDMENSHGDGWADGGWSLVSPRVIDDWTGGGATMIGISDLQAFEPRKVTTWAEIMG